MKKFFIVMLVTSFLLTGFSASAFNVATDSYEDLGFISSSFLKQGREADRAVRYSPWLVNYALQTNEEAQFVKGGEGFQQISDIAISPFDNSLMLFGTDTSGLWRSTDGGENWININDGVNCWGIHDIIFHPADKNVVYMIQGGPNNSTSTMQIQSRSTLDGLYKSTDGGKSWKQILDVQIRSSLTTNRLMAFDNENNFYLLSAEGLLKTADDGNSWIKIYDFQSSFGRTDMLNYDLCVSGNTIVFTNDTYGIFVSYNNGTSWQTKNPDALSEISAYGVDIDPEDSNHWLCCFGSPYYELYETTNAGESWSLLSTGANASPDNGKHPIKIMYGKRNANGIRKLYMMFEQIHTPFRVSENEGSSWSEASYSTLWGERTSPLYGTAICFDGNDDETIYLGAGTLLKSTDGGYNFTARNTPGFSGAYVKNILFSQTGKLHLSVTDRGFYKAETAYAKGTYSTFLHNRDQNYGSVGTIGIDPENENHILYAECTSNNYRLRESNDGGNSWSYIAGTEASTAPDVIEFHSKNENIIYTSQYTSYNAGLSWVANERKISAVSKENPDVVFSVNNNSVYKSDNCGETYFEYCTTNHQINYIMCDSINANKIYLGLVNGNIVVYDGTTKTILDESNGLNNVVPQAMAQNPKNPLHIVMGGQCFDRTSAGNYYVNYCKTPGLYETYDGGTTWHIVKGIPSMRVVRSLAFTPNSNEILIGGFTGGLLVYDYEAYKKYLNSSNSINEGFTAVFNSTTNKVYISGSINTQSSDVYSTLLVLPSNVMPGKATERDVIYISQVKIDESGDFEYEFKMPRKANEGTYSVYLGGSGINLTGVCDFYNGFFRVCAFEFSGESEITASLSVVNTTDSSKNVMLILAQYSMDENNNLRLLDLTMNKHTILPGIGETVTKTISSKLNPDTDCYRAYAWESLYSLVPLTEFIENK